MSVVSFSMIQFCRPQSDYCIIKPFEDIELDSVWQEKWFSNQSIRPRQTLKAERAEREREREFRSIYEQT